MTAALASAASGLHGPDLPRPDPQGQTLPDADPRGPDLRGPDRRARATAAYADAGGAVVTPRQAEYRVFARVTHRLSTALAAAAPAATGPAARTAAFARLAEAVNDNRRLWAALAADLAAPHNGLPDALRAQLISLAAFTLSQSERVLTGAGGAEPLVEINRSVMRGLRGDAEAG